MSSRKRGLRTRNEPKDSGKRSVRCSRKSVTRSSRNRSKAYLKSYPEGIVEAPQPRRRKTRRNANGKDGEGDALKKVAMEREWHRRHPDFESFDHIELKVVPRYKTSGLSGDEWRTSVNVKFYFKGEMVHEQHFRDMRTALMLMPRAWIVTQEPIPERIIKLEEVKCDQPGCPNDAISKYLVKRLTSSRGEYLHEDESKHTRYIRRFCETHLCRGDCGREDSNDNYEVLEGPGPDGSTNTKTSPSAGPVVLDLKTETRRKKKK